MMKVYTASDLPQVEMRKGFLEEQGIACVLRNQYTLIANGEIPFTDRWPELWVLNEAETPAALAILKGQPDKERPVCAAWMCANCGEESEGQFTSCWNCSSDRPEPPAA